MAEANSARAARALVGLTGSNPRCYVPGSAVLRGTLLEWTEKCSATCRHDAACHMSRAALLPSGRLDLVNRPEEQR